MEEIDPILHQPVRTQLVAYLAGRNEATFSELKRALGQTDGNLDAHIRKLLEADYLSARKDASSGRTQTIYALTDMGREALSLYVTQLSKLLEPAAEASNRHFQNHPSTT